MSGRQIRPGQAARGIAIHAPDRQVVCRAAPPDHGNPEFQLLEVHYSGGRWYLYALAAAGQAGVERAIARLQGELDRDMKLMGMRSVAELSRGNIAWR